MTARRRQVLPVNTCRWVGVGVVEAAAAVDDMGAGGHDIEDEAGEAVVGGVAVGVVHENADGAAMAVGGADVEAFDLDGAWWSRTQTIIRQNPRCGWGSAGWLSCEPGEVGRRPPCVPLHLGSTDPAARSGCCVVAVLVERHSEVVAVSVRAGFTGATAAADRRVPTVLDGLAAL